MIVLAHVSDAHLDCGARNAERAARVMSYLNDLPGPVDAVVVTGDIADHGLPASTTRRARYSPRHALKNSNNSGNL